MFYTAVAGDIPQGVACAANLNSIRARLLLCHKPARASIHGPMFLTTSLHIALVRNYSTPELHHSDLFVLPMSAAILG